MIAAADCGAVMLTVAPNRIAADAIRALAGRGVLVSLGHSEASYEAAQAGLAAGARAFTHLFNAMSPFQGRAPGMVGAALDAKDAFVGIIADGHHVHPASLQIAFAAKPHDRMMLITDAMPPAADGPDSFLLQGRRVARVDGCLRLDDGAIAGSLITMDDAVRYCVDTVGVRLADALSMASRVPAAFLRRDRDLGRIAPGYLASLVHLDDALRVERDVGRGRADARQSRRLTSALQADNLAGTDAFVRRENDAQRVERVFVMLGQIHPASDRPEEQTLLALAQFLVTRFVLSRDDLIGFHERIVCVQRRVMDA